MLFFLLPIFSGAMIAFQSTCNGLLFPFFGVLGVGFICHSIAVVLGIITIPAYYKRLPRCKNLPLYTTFGGPLSALVLGLSGYLVTKLGPAITVCLSVAGQLFMSSIVDHFGWFGTDVLRFRKNRIPGFVIILGGVVLINFLNTGIGDNTLSPLMLMLHLIFALGIGFITIFCRMFSYRASQFVTSIEAAFFSSLCGVIVIFIIYMITIRGHFPFGNITLPPVYAYLTGVVTIFACVLNNITYQKMPIVHATILLLVGQISFGIIADRLMLGTLSVGKIIGISVVTAGIFLDKWVSAKNGKEK